MEVRVWWVVSVLIAGVLCFLPLTSLLGYESSAVMGVVLGLISMRLTTLELGSPSAQRERHPINWWLDRLGARLVFTVPAAGVLLLNALRVQNCDPLAGMLFWLVIPCVSVLFAHSLLFVAARLTGSPVMAQWLSIGVVLVDTLWFGLRLALEPPITGVHTLFGYFAGSIYDEALSVPEPLLWYRLLVVAGSFGVVLLQEAVARGRATQSFRTVGWAAALSCGAALAIATRAEQLGFWLDRDDIVARLGASVESPHFIIHYDPSDLSAEKVEALVSDHEYRYSELRAFFDEDPIRDVGRPLHSFIYPDRGTQQRLFGSRNTFVARPWTYEMHVRWSQTGDTAIAHELAHLFTAPFGGGPLSLATDNGLFVHLGLVEGIALAADWPPRELTPHEAAAAMRQLDIAPNLRVLFEPSGFWSQPSGKAYTLMGSFVRWLVDTHGMAAFKEVYAYGDWHGVYGQKPEALIADWERFVDRHSVDESRLEMARFKYSRNSIFKKICARTIAELRRQARNAESSGDYERAIDLQTDIRGFQKKSPDPGLEIARLLVKLEQWDDATALLDELLARSGQAALKPKTRAKVEELRADILWQADRRADAAHAYERCLGFGHSDSERRLLHLKLLGTTTDDHDEASFAFQYLFESKGRTRALWTARQWTDHAPADPLARYLLGLQLYSAGLSAEAVPYFQGAAGSLALNVLDEQRRVLLARALANTDALDEAHTVWTGLLDADSSRVRLLAVEGLDRIRFARDEALPAHPVAP